MKAMFVRASGEVISLGIRFEPQTEDERTILEIFVKRASAQACSFQFSGRIESGPGSSCLGRLVKVPEVRSSPPSPPSPPLPTPVAPPLIPEDLQVVLRRLVALHGMHAVMTSLCEIDDEISEASKSVASSVEPAMEAPVGGSLGDADADVSEGPAEETPESP